MDAGQKKVVLNAEEVKEMEAKYNYFALIEIMLSNLKIMDREVSNLVHALGSNDNLKNEDDIWRVVYNLDYRIFTLSEILVKRYKKSKTQFSSTSREYGGTRN